MSGSDIVEIVDYTAKVAGGIDGVKAVFGSGQGLTDDPLRPGHKIATADANPAVPYTHWSDVPNAPAVTWESQTGTVEVRWTIPMRLWLPFDEKEARRMALPFYDRYLRAFVLDNHLGGLALRTEILRFAIGGDKNWSWLDVGLLVVERVNYAQ